MDGIWQKPTTTIDLKRRMAVRIPTEIMIWALLCYERRTLVIVAFVLRLSLTSIAERGGFAFM